MTVVRRPASYSGHGCVSSFANLERRCRTWRGSNDHDILRLGLFSREKAMYAVIRKFTRMRSVPQAARRAESGIGQMLKQCPGFQGYYILDVGGGVGTSVTFFDTQEAALAANDKALAWIQASLADLIDGEPEITAGEVLVAITL